LDFQICCCADGRKFAFCISPEGLEFGGGQVFEGARGSFLHLAKALAKSQIAAAERHFGVDAQMTAKVYDGEQEIAQFGFNLRVACWTARPMLG